MGHFSTRGSEGGAMKLADRVQLFTESVIREMTREAQKYDAINLAQGMPDFDPPQEIIDAACRALRDGFNQYAVTWGAPSLRQVLAEKVTKQLGRECDPDRHVTVCCGATECMMATMLALVNPGDEVVAFQPFYENYGPDTLLSGASVRWVHLHPPEWTLDRQELKRAFSSRTKAIIINTPNNPTGRVFTREELGWIAEECHRHDVIAISDEIYEHILYDDRTHVSIASIEGMHDRTVLISGLSKTFSVTGWRLGYCIAPETISVGIRRVHDFLTVGAPHPLQIAATTALRLPASYYADLADSYRRKRDLFLSYLRQTRLPFHDPQGAYYVLVDISSTGARTDRHFVDWLVREIGVAAVPGSSFFAPAELGHRWIRFMFAKREETLHEAGRRLIQIPDRLRHYKP
jgi:aminotransferase